MSVIKGWKFPVQVDKENGRIKTVEDNENIKQSVRMILETRPNERKVVPRFGADLRPYMFETINPGVISSLEGEVEMAAGCLKRLYTLSGKVVHGFHLGHELGFPTANIQPDDSCQLIPKTGVYAVRVTLDNGEMYAGMLNIGNRPTMDNGNKISIEVHLLHFEGDL